MTNPTVEVVATDEEWRTAIPVLQQLWTDADPAEIHAWRDEPKYRLFGAYEDDELVGVAGVSIQRVLHHVRHAWVHDFVIDEGHRGDGYGSTLLAWIEEWADEQGCEYVALAAKLENKSAQRFYEGNDVERWGYVMETKL
jgi:GNAT superfamily N-acetyltransferase